MSETVTINGKYVIHHFTVIVTTKAIYVLPRKFRVMTNRYSNMNLQVTTKNGLETGCAKKRKAERLHCALCSYLSFTIKSLCIVFHI